MNFQYSLCESVKESPIQLLSKKIRIPKIWMPKMWNPLSSIRAISGAGALVKDLYKTIQIALEKAKLFLQTTETKEPEFVTFDIPMMSLEYIIAINTLEALKRIQALTNKINRNIEELQTKLIEEKLNKELEQVLTSLKNNVQNLLENHKNMFNDKYKEKIDIDIYKDSSKKYVVHWKEETKTLLNSKKVRINALSNALSESIKKLYSTHKEQPSIDNEKKLLLIKYKWKFIRRIQNAQTIKEIKSALSAFNQNVTTNNIFHEEQRKFLEATFQSAISALETAIEKKVKTVEEALQATIVDPYKIDLFSEGKSDITQFTLKCDKIEKEIAPFFLINIDPNYLNLLPKNSSILIKQYSENIENILDNLVTPYNDESRADINVIIAQKTTSTTHALYNQIHDEILKNKTYFTSTREKDLPTIVVRPTETLTGLLKQYKNIRETYQNLENKIKSVQDKQIKVSLDEKLQKIKIEDESFYLEPEQQQRLNELQQQVKKIEEEIPSFMKQVLQEAGKTVQKFFTQETEEEQHKKKQEDLAKQINTLSDNLTKIIDTLSDDNSKLIQQEKIQSIINSLKSVEIKLDELDSLKKSIETIIKEENEKKTLYRSIIKQRKNIQQKVNTIEDKILKKNLEKELQEHAIALPENDETVQILLKEKKEFEEIQKKLGDIEKQIPTVIEKIGKDIGTFFEGIFGSKKEDEPQKGKSQ
jgi:hypothetical protein